MIVCLCHRVSDRDIVRHAQAGCASFSQLQAHSRVATGCGCCRDSAQETFEAARSCCGGGHAASSVEAGARLVACAV